MFPLITYLVLLAISSANARKSLEVNLLGPQDVNDVDNFDVVTNVRNTGDETLKLFPHPKTVLSSFPENSFSLKAAGTRPQFVGATAKYVFGATTEFVILAPGESKNVTHSLGSAYKFPTGGDYEVEASKTFYYADELGNPIAITADSAGTHSVKLKGNLVSSKVAARSVSMRKRAEWAGCSAANQTIITSALSIAMLYLSDSVVYLSNQTGSTTRYKTWFGTYATDRHKTVENQFSAIQNSDPSTYSYDCSGIECDPGTYSFVYPNIFGVVHLCSSFWSAPLNGTDSKAGTIIHEASHFIPGGGTADYASGQSGCKELAISSPTKAIMNADCYEYFAENTPILP